MPPALWAAEGFLLCSLTSCGGPITGCLVETRGPPHPGHIVVLVRASRELGHTAGSEWRAG